MKNIFIVLILSVCSISFAKPAAKWPIAISVPDKAFGSLEALSNNGEFAIIRISDDEYPAKYDTQFLILNLASGKSEVLTKVPGGRTSYVLFSADDKYIVHVTAPDVFADDNQGASIQQFVLDGAGHVVDSHVIAQSADVSKDNLGTERLELFDNNVLIFEKQFATDKKAQAVAYNLDTRASTVIYEETYLQIGHFSIQTPVVHTVNHSKGLLIIGWPKGSSSTEADMFLYSLNDGKTSALGLVDKDADGELMIPIEFNHDSDLPWMTFDRGQGPNGLNRYVRNYLTGETIQIYQDPTAWILGEDFFHVHGDWLHFDDQRQLNHGLSIAFNTKTHARLEGAIDHLSKSGKWAFIHNNLGDRVIEMQSGIAQYPYMPVDGVTHPVRLINNMDDGYFILHEEIADPKKPFQLTLYQVPLFAKRGESKVLGTIEGDRGGSFDWGCNDNPMRHSVVCQAAGPNGKKREVKIWELPLQ